MNRPDLADQPALLLALENARRERPQAQCRRGSAWIGVRHEDGRETWWFALSDGRSLRSGFAPEPVGEVSVKVALAPEQADALAQGDQVPMPAEGDVIFLDALLQQLMAPVAQRPAWKGPGA